MLLGRTCPIRVVPSTRWFTTTSVTFREKSVVSYQQPLVIRKTFVDDETLIENKDKYNTIRKAKLDAELRKYGGRLKPIYKKAIEEYKQGKVDKPPVIPAKLSHPLLIIDVANSMATRYNDKFFSHIGAATDLHRELRNAMKLNDALPKTVNVEVAPETPPKIEIALVLEKFFRQGAYEGTIGNDEMWLRTIHAPDTRIVNRDQGRDAGDDAIVLAAQRARDEERKVTVATSDKALSARVARFGCSVLDPLFFISELDAAKAVETDEAGAQDRIGTRITETIEQNARSERLVIDDYVAQSHRRKLRRGHIKPID